MGLGHTPVEQFCYNLPHQPTLSGSSLSGHHLDDSVAREGHDAVEIEFPFYPIFEMVSLPIVQPRYSFQPFVHSSNVFAKIAIKIKYTWKTTANYAKNQMYLKKYVFIPLWFICSCYPYDDPFVWVRVGENANTISILLVSICLINWQKTGSEKAKIENGWPLARFFAIFGLFSNLLNISNFDF